jgi:hypothetical protein
LEMLKLLTFTKRYYLVALLPLLLIFPPTIVEPKRV